MTTLSPTYCWFCSECNHGPQTTKLNPTCCNCSHPLDYKQTIVGQKGEKLIVDTSSQLTEGGIFEIPNSALPDTSQLLSQHEFNYHGYIEPDLPTPSVYEPLLPKASSHDSLLDNRINLENQSSDGVSNDISSNSDWSSSIWSTEETEATLSIDRDVLLKAKYLACKIVDSLAGIGERQESREPPIPIMALHPSEAALPRQALLQIKPLARPNENEVINVLENHNHGMKGTRMVKMAMRMVLKIEQRTYPPSLVSHVLSSYTVREGLTCVLPVGRKAGKILPG